MPCYQISVDGYAACGKSTLARSLARELNFLYIDSGAMYRAVSLFFLNQEINPLDKNITSLIEELDISLSFPNNESRAIVHLNNRDVTDEIRTQQVSNQVSQVAAIPSVRKKLVALQQKYGEKNNIVMDGRDIGTVVFPNAVLKLFITAEMETRIIRRKKEIESKGREATYDDIKNNLKSRDYLDSTRNDSPLKKASDAVLLDTTNLTRKEQLSMVLALANCRIH
ncbi:(d)CMP kinase [Membranihabitans maritimus]|uniref:(d)CMP kinase n=1 Tax=Membranihabitans maritimus TaxID=2904244 RepID=UPI001F00C617|nr:(d)CMP kinase [Membranihabitans maritimus]